jgi:heme exporter protein D
METGVIQGGWEYVWAAYAVTATILVGYGLSIVMRHRSAMRRRTSGGSEVTR